MWKRFIHLFLAVVVTCTFTVSKATVIHALADFNTDEKSSHQLVPLPQQVDFESGTLQISDRVNVQGKELADEDALRILEQFLQKNNIAINEEFDKTSTTLALGEEGSLNSKVQNLDEELKLPSVSKLKEEGYFLAVQSDANQISEGGTIVLKGKDGDGTFYAVKTLIQLAEKKDGSLIFNNVRITDEPSMRIRGIIEGFYGNPWSHEDRLDQIKFYGDYKMNTYIYAPKDDPYHREKWRSPYPESEMERMEELIKTADENKVDFVFAISPGIDISFDGQKGEEDFQALLEKCESLYEMGVRSFAILFDDISNRDGVKQAELLNRFNAEFVKTKEDVKPLMTVPTEYDTRAMGVIGDLSTYTEDFSTALDNDIKVMWTGQAVVSENLPLKNVEFMRSVYGDQIGVWWNYPVTDYLRSKLALGPIIDIDKRLEGKLDFFTMNPMEHANLSKITLATGADYSWNISEYSSDRSWNRSIELLFDDLASEMKTFANHSSRMIGSWSIGREDAEDVRDTMDQLWLNLSKSKDATEEIQALREEFADMIHAADNLKANLPEDILNESAANLDKLKLLGENGQLALDMVLAQINDEDDAYERIKNELEGKISNLSKGARVSEETVLAFIKEAVAFNPLPVASFEVSKTFVAPGEEIQFENTSNLATVDLEWTFEGAKVEKSTEKNPTVVYENEGIYTVKLVGRNSLGKSEIMKEGIVTVSNLAKNETTNLALNKDTAASSFVNDREAPPFAVDGSTRTKWCAVGPAPHTLTVDLGKTNLVSEIVIKHAEEGGEPAGSNTAAYRVEISEDGENFKELVKVTNNEAGITSNQVPATKGRYVRLIVDKPTQGDDSAARIYEFEVLGVEGDVNLPPKYEKPQVDKSNLDMVVNDAELKQKSDYTSKSWDAFMKALDEAKAVLQSNSASQEEVDQAQSSLKQAQAGLMYREEATEDAESDVTDQPQESQQGQELPETAGNTYNILLLGMLLLTIGVLTLRRRIKREG
ncbi:O-GlcNAcase NagJ precursor [Paraliobacillus sp. PM-2]|uniref:beta-N-acetylglucosaminidase domain-containing protein n=1 Tax=Paraliobacillus sp. PM-2 TaxID=1462524 RepID=UPI00061CC513|nr:beta-N-acetylglucosaminidase domain-containing protein [Paraliobacillus sp. PM-2]CQR45976.1 O-GlcNAcase NagJ precursor [Paraliobacillus sp. PM-2]